MKKPIPHRVFAANLGTNNILVTIVETQIEFKENTQILSTTLQWLAKSYIMHENNRQNIVDYLKPLVGIKNDVAIRDL
uniref:Uncharacterized protein n=1 Tax=Megaselia scalaris TaxID=36166 RepID=T1GU32_MEGSC